MNSVAPPPAELLGVRGLGVEFRAGRGSALRAVDDVSFAIAPGETVGLVGESGSGKTTLGRAILGLVPVAGGTISFAGHDITRAGYRERRRLSADLQVVFQDPYSSLNPTRTIGQTLGETLRGQGEKDQRAIAERVRGMLERVGLPADAAGRFPGQFSGGQRQRVSIARALMARPRLVICDEPTSALDLSVQAQVLNLLHSLQQELDLSYLLISHDLAVVRHLSHRVIVLYQGRVMESGPAREATTRPGHPYTRALLAAAPVPDPVAQRERRATRLARPGGGSESRVADACPFAPRCPHVIDACRASRPPLEATPDGTLVACHRWEELRASTTGAWPAIAQPAGEPAS